MFLRKFGNEHAVGGMEAKTNLVAELAAHGVSIQLPVFTRSSPKSWFTIIEANFHVRGVSMPDTKYWHAVSKLDADTLEEIQEFLATDRGKDPYQELKEHLCEVFEPTQQQKLDQFLSMTVMGEKRPSAFLQRARADGGGHPSLPDRQTCLYTFPSAQDRHSDCGEYKLHPQGARQGGRPGLG